MARIPLPSRVPHGLAGRRRDAFALDFIAGTRRSTEFGDRLANAEIDRLHALARAIAAAVAGWRGLCAPLEVAGSRPFDAARVASLIVETVFDEVLSPPAWRVLSAALEAAREARP